jgi:hypothetical protein
MKEVADIYNEYHKSLKKEITKTSEVEGHPTLMDRLNQHCENDYTTESNLCIQCNPFQNSSDILHQDRKVNP